MESAGVVLDATLDAVDGDREIAEWKRCVSILAARLGWSVELHVRRHRSGAGTPSRAMLAFTAPIDTLLTATLVNEWAWSVAAVDGRRRAEAVMNGADPTEVLWPADAEEAFACARAAAEAERNAPLLALATEAARRGVPLLFDDESASIGYGIGSLSWPVRAIPSVSDIAWSDVAEIPVALVTGSNGKTTTVRLVAAMLARAGHVVGYSCSDGVFVGAECVERGDWSGPGGARLVLRDRRVTAAVLETARGGLLRRGLVVPHATAAIVTNVAEDHFGAYGITTLEQLAEVKLVVARAVGETGVLVINDDDPTLASVDVRTNGTVERFSIAAPDPLTPPISEMPLTLGGAARHNIANAVGAAHVARALGVETALVHDTLRAFGSDNADNAGRLERFLLDGLRVWVDYAHNPHGLGALLAAARDARGDGRLGLLLGQAGDRDDDAIRALARTAWDARPDRIVLKDVAGYMRGRVEGEVPAILEQELLRVGAPAEALSTVVEEARGVEVLLAWARAGDLLVLPVHALSARDSVLEMINQRR
jgi:cyanophycin synthetase